MTPEAGRSARSTRATSEQREGDPGLLTRSISAWRPRGLCSPPKTLRRFAPSCAFFSRRAAVATLSSRLENLEREGAETYLHRELSPHSKALLDRLRDPSLPPLPDDPASPVLDLQSEL